MDRWAEDPVDGASAAQDDVLLAEPFTGIATDDPWVDGSRHGAWQSVYDGYGTVLLRGGQPVALSQRPMAATSEEETHAALAVTVQEYSAVDVTVRQRTVEQLRVPDPNTWEVPWLLWGHSDDEHFYYLVLKPNGWELGKADPAYPGAQRFLATGSSPTFGVGDWHTARVRHTGDTIEVWGDGQFLTRFVDRERPYRGGHVGLYTEDAHVEHVDLVIRRAD
ncbi:MULTISPECIES: family 16 glycoside hydrolase [Geodermatophilus]|uniref:Family 16 glycoside hydrolase n=1 Tax=Geodermatophilus arenarius TaxID=1137990 RepID=A0ABV9LKM7_9ACTN